MRLSARLRWLSYGWIVGLALIALSTLRAGAQGPVKQWDRSYGGSSGDYLTSVQPTADGGYILGGHSESGISSEKSQPCRGEADYWIIKVDSSGQKQWDRTFGGNKRDLLQAVYQTADGGYILGGYSDSGLSGDKTVPSQPSERDLFPTDYWIIKLDATGTKEWDQAVGGNNTDLLQCLQQTTDGGYILGGYSYSEASGDKTEPSRGSSDWWVVKLDKQGRKQWDRTLGGERQDGLSCLYQTPEGGYLLGGTSGSTLAGDRTQPSRGSNDFWVVKLDAQGRTQWDRAYGGTLGEALTSLQPTLDGGFILGGWSESAASGEKTQPNHGITDYWLVKITATGTLQWERTYGGDELDQLTVVRQTADQGYLLAGVSTSGVSFDKTQPNRQGGNAGFDYWAVKVDAAGVKQWDRTYGGDSDDYLNGLVATADGGYLLGGYSSSGVSGDKTQASKGYGDYWLVKLKAAGLAAAPAPVSVHIKGDSLLCATRPLTLTASATPVPLAYRWNTGATTPSIQVTQPGDYSVQASFSSNVTSSAHYLVRAVTAPALPLFTLGADTTLCLGDRFVLRPPSELGSGVTYHWADGSTSPTLLVHEAGTYRLEVRTACESRTATRQVSVRPCLSPVTIPNVITPTGDGQNEYFTILGLGTQPWELTLYSRWGKLVYQTSHYHNEWGQQALTGLYYYLLRQPNTGQTYKGWVEVFR